MFLVADSFYLGLLNRLPQRVSLALNPSNHERVFITSIHWNNEKNLRSHWNKAVVDLVKYLRPANVFVAILESGSWDDSEGALRELDAQLAQMDVPRSIMLEDITHNDEICQTGQVAHGHGEAARSSSVSPS
jgi:hypothetical protein